MSDVNCAPGFVVSFTDRRGVQREAPFLGTDSSDGSLMMFSDRLVGLLYLPDIEAVIITDLLVGYPWADEAAFLEEAEAELQNYTDEPEKFTKCTKYANFVDDEIGSWKRVENMSQEEITAKLKEMAERRNSDK